VNFSVVIKKKLVIEINELPPKTRRIIFESLQKLERNPWPGVMGNKERLQLDEGNEVYRLHIGRNYTVFYTIHKEDAIVKIHNIMTIGQAHKRYGRL